MVAHLLCVHRVLCRAATAAFEASRTREESPGTACRTDFKSGSTPTRLALSDIHLSVPLWPEPCACTGSEPITMELPNPVV